MDDEKGKQIFYSSSGKKKGKKNKDKINPYELLNTHTEEKKLSDEYTTKTADSSNKAYYENIQKEKLNRKANAAKKTQNNKIYWWIFLVILFFVAFYLFKNYLFI